MNHSRPLRLSHDGDASMGTTSTPGTGYGDEIDFRAMLGSLIDHKRLIIIVTAIFFLLGIAYVFIATPVYQANALLQVEQPPPMPGVPELAQAANATNPEATDALSILTSQSVVKAAVDKLGLDIVVDPYRVPFIGGLVARGFKPAAPGDVARPWLGMRSYDWGGASLDIPRLDVPADLLGKRLTLVAGKDGNYELWEDGALPWSHGEMLLRGQVGRVATGSGVTMQVKTLYADPGMCFHVVRNDEVATIQNLQKAIIAKPTDAGSDVIAISYDNGTPQLAVAVLDAITHAYLAQNVTRNSAQAANSLKFVNRQLPVVRNKLENAQAALNAFQIKTHSVNVPMQTQSLLTQIDTTDASIQQLETQKVNAARLYTPMNPAYQALDRQIAQLRSMRAGLERRLNMLPDTQREMLSLNGKVRVLNNTFSGLLNEAQQLEIAQAGTVGTARIVDPPSVDITRPVKPKKKTTVLGCAIVGALLSMGFVLLRRSLNRGVEDPVEIEQLGLPVYAAVPLSEQQLELSEHHAGLFARRRENLLALAAPEDLAAEALRSLRTTLHYAQVGATDNRVMICASSSMAGKTFVSANLAALDAQSGRRVLLIDANMRDGRLHGMLGGRAEDGLSDLLVQRIVLDEAVRTVEGIAGLHFIASGRRPPNPSELLMQPGFAALLHELSPRYDLVVIDSPPILAVTDAAIIGHHVGTSLLVVRFGLNQSREIEQAMHRFRQSGVEIKGVVFNGMEKRSAGYSAYGINGYAIGE